jgi:hypothetical protein
LVSNKLFFNNLPESVHTGSLSSPILRAYVASSNGFCICPFEKNPKSPFFDADEQSLYFDAKFSNFSSPLTILFLKANLLFN